MPADAGVLDSIVVQIPTVIYDKDTYLEWFTSKYHPPSTQGRLGYHWPSGRQRINIIPMEFTHLQLVVLFILKSHGIEPIGHVVYRAKNAMRRFNAKQLIVAHHRTSEDIILKNVKWSVMCNFIFRLYMLIR